MEDQVKYPIGQQDFKILRETGCLYVDKTRFIRNIVDSGVMYYFLARPRRFGKSLFLSTLRYFFEGERSLFKGLYIDSTDWKWEKYPVLRLDLNTDRFAEIGKLDVVLENLFIQWETKYDIKCVASDLSQRFNNIISAAHAKTGRKVVILVDEYDKPLVGNINNQLSLEHYRAKLSSLYSNFKSSAEHIKLVFLTGVSRFSKLSVFSDLNNLKDISFSGAYADVCGVTEPELIEYFKEGISRLADKRGESIEKALSNLKQSYDGYRFAAEGSDIYNPWSLLNAMDESEIGNYWNDTGIPTVVAESLKHVNADLESMFNITCREEEVKGLDLLNPEPPALLYQTGYITIKKYLPKLKKFRMGIPNKEVKTGLYNFLLPYYMKVRRGSVNKSVDDIIDGFILGNPEKAMLAMQTFFAGIDYRMKIENENNFHNAFFLLTHIIGLDVKTEVHTSDGSIDILLETEDYVYIIELKFDHSPADALRQIENKQYVRPWQTDERHLFLIGVSFSSATRCIKGWEIVDYERLR